MFSLTHSYLAQYAAGGETPRQSHRGNLRGILTKASTRKLATTNVKSAVFLIPDIPDDIATTDCVVNVTQVVEDEYGLDVVVEGEEPSDPIVLDEFTVCNETFIADSLLQHQKMD